MGVERVLRLTDDRPLFSVSVFTPFLQPSLCRFRRARWDRCTLILVGWLLDCLKVMYYYSENGIYIHIRDTVPAFVTRVTMPFTYSIVAYGLITGLFTYSALATLIFITIKLGLSEY